jgi:hypothetical protein
MGRVFLGRSPGGRLVAVKVIRAELADDRDFRARFGREVAAARKVNGLFTALVVDADVAAPTPWLATAYVAGPSLAEAVTAYGPLPAEQVLTLAAGLAEGLTAVHAAGVVHRDLKPSNVMLAEDGPRVIDFGISRALEASALTHTGQVVGSPGFMSPEQAEGRDVGPPSDLFSLGALVVFAATGNGPFGTGSTAALVYRVVHAAPETGGVPGQIRDLIDRCLAKNPPERPTADQLLAELSRIHPAPAAPVSWLPPEIAQPPRDQLPLHEDRKFAAAVPVSAGTAGERPAAAQPLATPPAAAEPAAPSADGPPTVTVAWQPHIPAQAGSAGIRADATVPPLPGVPALDAQARARRRRRWAAVLVAAAVALGGAGGGLAVWKPWRSPPVLRPGGLVADAVTAGSIAIHWASPATGPLPDRYVIFQDGRQVGSVRGTVTFYQARALAPASQYQYQVMAVRGERHSGRSSALTAQTTTPPVSAARLDGNWRAHYRVISSTDTDPFFSPGKKWTDSWSFQPQCGAGPCTVTLSGAITGWPFTSVLIRSGTVYTGTASMHTLEYCLYKSNEVHDRLKIRIDVGSAGVNGQEWKATAWSGTMVIDSEYTAAGNCAAGVVNVGIRGTP